MEKVWYSRMNEQSRLRVLRLRLSMHDPSRQWQPVRRMDLKWVIESEDAQMSSRKSPYDEAARYRDSVERGWHATQLCSREGKARMDRYATHPGPLA